MIVQVREDQRSEDQRRQDKRVNVCVCVDLEHVVSWFEVSDVDPLTVDVVSVGVPAAHRDALLPEVGALVPLLDTCAHTRVRPPSSRRPPSHPWSAHHLRHTQSPPDRNWPCGLQPP